MKKNFNCIIEEKSFVKNNETVTYYAISVDIDGNTIIVAPKESDKKLFNYLIKDNFKGGEK